MNGLIAFVVACSCDVRGTTSTNRLTFLDCVSDEEELSSHPGKEPGDCYCKANVYGRKCDQCKSEYFNLTRDNPQGCSECRCHLPGTVNSSNLCNSSETGQCPCKTHVELRDCSQCKHGYYNLTNETVDGCTSCECDEGGTYPANTCDKVSGQCQCRANVIGKKCKGVPDGFYYPDFHFIVGTRDPYAPATNNLYAWLHIPKTANYRLFLKATNGDRVAISNGTMTSSFNLTEKELKTCTHDSASYCLLRKGNYSVNVTVNSSIKLESIVAIPEDFLTIRILEGPRRNLFIFHCDVETNDVGVTAESKEVCLEGALSLTVAFNNGSLPCSCHPLGSFNHTVCQKYGGACDCKPGVEGRDCSRCKAGYYNLTRDGCSPCSCKGTNNVCHPVTGMCECPGNTTGRMCEPCQCNNNTNQCLRSGECLACQYNTTGFYCNKCVNQTYGDASKQQCRACDCDPEGSYGSICDTENGQCACKPHVTGRTCNQCKNNTYGFGSNGCTPCNCSLYGSLDLQCNTSGHCSCKPEANGTKCSQCRVGYYGIPIQPCTACSCNENGTVNGSVCSNDAHGQCQCKPGVAGRACDQCKEYHFDLTEHGCSACPACVMNLKKTIDTTESELNTTEEKAKNLKELARLHEPLQNVEQKADELAVKATSFSARLAEADTVHQGLVQKDLPDASKRYEEQMRKADELKTRAPATAQNMSQHLGRVKELYNRTAEADLFVTSVDGLLQDIANTFAMHLQHSNQSLIEASVIVSASLVHDFSNYEMVVGQSVQDAENLTAFVSGLARKLLNQTSLAKDLNAHVLSNHQNISHLLVRLNSTHEEFMRFLTDVTIEFSGVHYLINQTKELLSLESHRLKEAQDLGFQSQDTLNKTKRLLQEATSAFEQYKTMVEAVSGELRVSMLKYDDEGHRFGVKVLQGRNLSPRDQPSGKANPYVLMSLVPNTYGLQRSIIINDTLDPVWPEFAVYHFNIQHEQLLKSKLKLRVFDYDPEDDDDSMGETTIDLSSLGDETITNFYPLQSEDVSQIESGNFKPTSGLVDVSNLLLVQYEKVSTELGSVEGKLTQAHQKAQQLKSLAEQLEVEFNQSRSHGTAAIQAVQRYADVERIINSSFDALLRSQATVYRIASELNRVSVSELLAKANHELHNLTAFYNATLQRNLTSSEKALIESAISAANSTIQLSVQQWYEANTYYPALMQAEAKLDIASLLYAPGAIETVSQAQERTDYLSDSLTRLSNQWVDLERHLTDVFIKIEFVKNSSERDVRIIHAAYTNLNNTSLELNNASSNVLEALKQQQLLTNEQQECDTKLSALEQKLRTLKRRMSEVDLALKMNGDGANEYALPSRTLESPTRNELSITFKTNSSDGLLVNMLGENVDSQQTGFAVYITDGKVNVQYNTGQGPITLTNPVLVNNGQWDDVYFTRTGASSALTASTSRQSVTVTHNAPPGSENATIPLNNATVVLLGGPVLHRPGIAGAVENYSRLQYFRGTISRFSFDQVTLDLWMPQRSSNTAIYGVPQLPNYYYPRYGQAASFFDDGFLQQRTGEFTTDSDYVHVEFDFRTSKSNGTLFVVINEGRSTTVMAVFIQDGNVVVMVYFESGVEMLMSQSSNYYDSKWYHVSAVMNETSVALTVSQNGTILENMSKSLAAASRMHSGDFVFFGFLPPNSNVSLPINESFVGDMKDVSLNRNGTNTLVRRLFSATKGVATEGVLKGEVLSGAVRFYGYRTATRSCSYVDLDPKEQEVDSLSFSFKTSEPSGLLLFSSVKVGERFLFLYMALWHGKLILLTHNSTNPSQAKPTEIGNMKLNDNRWKTIHLNSSDSGYSVFVDGSLITTSWFGTNRLHPLRLSNPLYIGGVAKGVKINLHVPVTWCFNGDMKNEFKINSNEIDLLVQEREGVSGGFVTPPTPPLPPTPAPPTCAASAGPLTFSTNPKEVGFTAGFSSNPSQQSYMGFTMNENLSGMSSLFTLEVRPLTSNGLVLYIADNLTHPEQFISMEMIDGYVKYQVNFHPGHIQMKSSINYVQRNQWFKIHLLRIIDFGAFLIPLTKEYHKDKHENEVKRNLNLNRFLYIGGVPPHVKLHPLVTQRFGFSGCLKTLTFGSEKLEKELAFDLQNPTVSSKTSSCLSNAQPGMGFNGSSWANFGEKLASPSNFRLELEFRTSSRDGVLVYLRNDTVRQQPYLKLEQSSGQLVLSYRNASGAVHQVTWSALSSYLLCNMTWHKLTLNGIGDALNLTIDEEPAVTLNLPADTTLKGKLFSGGVPDNLSSPASKGFVGCLKNLRFGNSVLDLGRAVDARHAINGCPSTVNQPSKNGFA